MKIRMEIAYIDSYLDFRGSTQYTFFLLFKWLFFTSHEM